jgi:hypothetical protein
MNLATALKLDHQLTRHAEDAAVIDEMQAQIVAQAIYIKQLEAALLSAPVYRPGKPSTRAEADYVAKRDRWFGEHRPTITRAAAIPAIPQITRHAAQSKVVQLRSRIEFATRRQRAGDTTAKVPQGDELWAAMARELDKIGKT